MHLVTEKIQFSFNTPLASNKRDKAAAATAILGCKCNLAFILGKTKLIRQYVGRFCLKQICGLFMLAINFASSR